MDGRRIVLGEFGSRKKAQAAREALAGILGGKYDVTQDHYTVHFNGTTGYLRLDRVGTDTHVVLDTSS